MAITHGMNVEQVRQLGNLMKQKSNEITQMINQINSQLNGTNWEGPDAQGFKNSQWPDHRAKLQQVAQALDGFGQSAVQNASEQEGTSNR